MLPPTEFPDPLCVNNDWALLPSPTDSGEENNRQYFLIWIGDSPLTPRFIAAAESLNQEKNSSAFPGFKVVFHAEPTPGFLVHTKPNWNIQSDTQARTALEQILWEINRQIN